MITFKELAELLELKQLAYAAAIYAVPLTLYWTLVA
jgi:hypothetical protein